MQTLPLRPPLGGAAAASASIYNVILLYTLHILYYYTIIYVCIHIYIYIYIHVYYKVLRLLGQALRGARAGDLPHRRVLAQAGDMALH